MTPSPARVRSLAALLDSLPDARTSGDASFPVEELAVDSRDVRAGGVFVALRGERVDGHAYVAAAIAAGARAVVVDAAHAAAMPADARAATVVVGDTRRALSRLAAALYDEPASTLRVTGVTGTNGKTTTTHAIAAVLAAGGIPTGRIGTLGAAFGATTRTLANTTPPALELQGVLADMRDRGARAVAMEVSSHALALDRVADVAFAVGVLTNVTRDHLDFHGTFEAYAAAKRSLFARVPHAIFNADDACGQAWARACAAGGTTVVTYGFAANATLRARDVELHADGSRFVVDGTRVATRLPGRFNVHNALAALAVARAYGIADADAARALAHVERVPGRMEHVGGADVDVIVDYAHTPDALDAVLRSVRETTRGALVVVFGCGGDRDRGKRPEMGRIAAALADRVYVTSDNPRGEAPQSIVDDILAGVGRRPHVVARLDRRAAIREAVAAAAPGDVVVLAGKGHETYQIVGTAVNHFDDRAEALAALAARAGGRA